MQTKFFGLWKGKLLQVDASPCNFCYPLFSHKLFCFLVKVIKSSNIFGIGSKRSPWLPSIGGGINLVLLLMITLL